MKKLLSIIMLTILSISISACDFSDDFWQDLYDGLDSIADLEDLPEQVSREEAMRMHELGGAYIYWEDVMLYMDTSETIKVGIDDDMKQDFITASVFAIEELNKIDGIYMEYYMVDDINDLLSDRDEPDDFTLYKILITEYYDDNEDDNTLAYNAFWFDQFNTGSGEIFQSTIRYNLYYMNEMDLNYIKAIATHELAHSFGLDDLYQHSLDRVTLMYYQIDVSGETILLIGTLTGWDIANLEWFYKKEDTE
jgi:predicted Zn-dependent protease with MMP-like domain